MDELSEDDKLTVSRARKIQKFLSQPFSVAEVFTGKEGKLVPLDVSISLSLSLSLCLSVSSSLISVCVCLPLMLFIPFQATISGFKKIIDGKSGASLSSMCYFRQ